MEANLQIEWLFGIWMNILLCFRLKTLWIRRLFASTVCGQSTKVSLCFRVVILQMSQLCFRIVMEKVNVANLQFRWAFFWIQLHICMGYLSREWTEMLQMQWEMIWVSWTRLIYQRMMWAGLGEVYKDEGEGRYFAAPYEGKSVEVRKIKTALGDSLVWKTSYFLLCL